MPAYLLQFEHNQQQYERLKLGVQAFYPAFRRSAASAGPFDLWLTKKVLPRTYKPQLDKNTAEMFQDFRRLRAMRLPLYSCRYGRMWTRLRYAERITFPKSSTWLFTSRFPAPDPFPLRRNVASGH